jgi:hypothetical protein
MILKDIAWSCIERQRDISIYDTDLCPKAYCLRDAGSTQQANEKEALTLSGNLYRTSNTEDILSPYFASNPPEEKLKSRIRSKLGSVNPSWLPEWISKACRFQNH